MEHDIDALQLLPSQDGQTEMMCTSMSTCDTASSCAWSCHYTTIGTY